jgi:surfactin synthase thioesterase subunit
VLAVAVLSCNSIPIASKVGLLYRSIWGKQDIAVGRVGVEMARQYMKGEYSLVELDAGHTLVQEQFDRVDREILNHIQRHSIGK